MKSLNQQSTKIFNRIVTGLVGLGDHKKIDNAPGAFMALCVEVVDEWKEGNIISLAHYYEQNGDLMRDPDIIFLVSNGSVFIKGLVFPTSYRQDGLGIDRVSLFHNEEGRLMCCHGEQQDEVDFANTWMKNLQEQQGI